MAAVLDRVIHELSDKELKQLERQIVTELCNRPLTALDPDGPGLRYPNAAAVPGEAVETKAANALSRGLTLENVDEAFRYHTWSRYQNDCGEQVRDALIAAAKVILRVVPDGPDRSTALRKLREVRMDANSAITHQGRF